MNPILCIDTVPDTVLLPRPLRALIVDDEDRARATLRHLLADVAMTELVGEASDAEEAVRLALALEPDVVFLDVEMPGGSGLSVAGALPPGMAVVFTTAYDQHALAAFELGAVDYLHKPFGPERLARALARVRGPWARDGDAPPTDAPMGDDAAPAPLERVQWMARSTAPGAPPLTRLFVRERGRIVPLRTADIVHLDGHDDYVAVHAHGRRYLVYLTLGEFERRLDPDRFMRIHRSHIVNLDCVIALVPFDTTRLQVELRGGTTIVASRAASRELRRLAV